MKGREIAHSVTRGAFYLAIEKASGLLSGMAYFALLLWEFTVASTVVFAPRIPLALRGVELALAASVIALLFASAHLFPRAQLPRR